MTVSVAMCTYNGAKFLEDQILSILNQTVPVSEIVVCDDRSTDLTIEILKKLQKTNPQIKIHVNEENLGVIKNFEKAINLCKNEVIFLSDQDDLWKSDKVEKVIAYFQKNERIKCVFHNSELLSNHKELSLTFWESLVFRPEEDFLNFHENILLFGNVVAGSAMAFRKEKIELIQHQNIYHDFQLALHFAKKSEIGYLDECLSYYRIHENQQVGTTVAPSSSKTVFMKNILKRNIGVEDLKKIYLNYEKFRKLNLNQSKFDFEVDFLHQKLIDSRKIFLHRLSFVQKKKMLLIWYYRKIYAVQLKDVFFL